jgi:hypothetical protein
MWKKKISIICLITVRNTHTVTQNVVMEYVANIMRLKWTGGWFRYLIHRLVLPGLRVNFAFKTCKSHKTLTNRRIVPIFSFKHIGLHICTKLICDRSCSFESIDQKACRSYSKQYSSRDIARHLLYLWIISNYNALNILTDHGEVIINISRGGNH